MRIRRFIGKRRRKAARRLADQMSAKHLGLMDRYEIATFARYLRGEMDAQQKVQYESGSVPR